MEREGCFMIGLILWTTPENKKGMKVRERGILHMRFAAVEIPKGPKTPEAVLRRRVTAAAKRLQRSGVVRAVLPPDFAYLPQLEKCGVRPISTLALRRQLAADWACTAMEKRNLPAGSTKLAVVSRQLTGELVRTVTELSLRNRYVLLDLPYGGEELCRQLRREYGVSLLLGPGKEQLEAAEVLLLFDEREDLDRKNQVVLCLFEGAKDPLPPLVLPPALEEQLPGGADRTQLLAALQEAGALRPGQIALGRGTDFGASENPEK
jgi:hypothetical protein